jgi:hypothetical protein
MSEVLSTEQFVFHTDLGTMLVTAEQVQGYDVEDLVSDRAFSQAQDLVFQNIASNLDINAYQGPRTIQSTYSGV